MRDKWMSMGAENSRLGYPTTDEICGLKDGGCYQTFQGGYLVWSPATGTHVSWGRDPPGVGEQRCGERPPRLPDHR